MSDASDRPRAAAVKRPDLEHDITARTDSYFNRTRAIVEKFGDSRVNYAVFLRRPVISAPRIAVDLQASAAPSP